MISWKSPCLFSLFYNINIQNVELQYVQQYNVSVADFYSSDFITAADYSINSFQVVQDNTVREPVIHFGR